MVSISIAILTGIIIYADPVLLFSIMSKSDLRFVALALIASNISIAIRVLKWKVLLKNIGFLDLFPIQVFGVAASNFTPGKIAEPSKTIILKMKKGVAVSKTLPTVIWERIMDIIIVIMFSIIIIPFLTEAFILIALVSISAFLGIVVTFLLMLHKKSIGIKVFDFFRRLRRFWVEATKVALLQ